MILLQIPGPITVTTGSGIMCRNMQKRTTRIFSRYLYWTKATFLFVHPLTLTFPGLPGREGDGAGEGEQVEGRGDQGRGGQEGGGEEARGGGAREEARQGRHPRQVEDFYYFSLLILELLQAADAAEPADRAEDQRLCEAADVRERSRVGDVEEEEALPNFCIRFVFLLSLSFFSFLFLSLRRKKQYTISASGLSSFFTFMLRAQICSKIAS